MELDGVVPLLPLGLNLREVSLPPRIEVVEPLEDLIKCLLGIRIHVATESSDG